MVHITCGFWRSSGVAPWHRRFATFTKMAPASPTSMVFLPKSRRMRPWSFLCLRPGSNLLLGHSAMHAEELLKKSLLWKKHTTKIISKIHNFLCSEMYICIYIYIIYPNEFSHKRILAAFQLPWGFRFMSPMSTRNRLKRRFVFFELRVATS